MTTTKALSLSTNHIALEVHLPPSKSISNRALILNALAYSPYEVENLSDCDDTRVMIDAFDSNDTRFDVGAAGTSMRFLTAFLAKTVGEWTITGSQRMKNRPIKILVDALNALGGNITYLEREGFPPLKIYGSALTGGEIHLNGSISSQYISALMMIAPYMQKGLKIHLEGDIISEPYIRMTQKMMADFGVNAHFAHRTIQIKPGNYHPVHYRVEADWSAASYWYELLAFAESGNIVLHGLNNGGLQGDSRVAEIYKTFGIDTTYADDNRVIISKTADTHTHTPTHTQQPWEYNFVHVPDLAQTVAVTCCLKHRPFRFSGLQSLKIKETNRIEALICELKKLGFILFEPAPGALAWYGERCQPEQTPGIDTYDDHRMAMSFAPAAMFGAIEIRHPAVVSKSYPAFWQHLELLQQND